MAGEKIGIRLHDREVRIGACKLRLTPQFFDLYCYLALKRLEDEDKPGGFVETANIRGLRGWQRNDSLSIGKQIRRHIKDSEKNGVRAIEGVQKTAGPFRLIAERKQIRLDVALHVLKAYLGTLSVRQPLGSEQKQRLYQFVDRISRATIRTSDGMLDEALGLYREALGFALEPYQRTMALGNIARTLERQGEFQKALQTCKRSVLELRRAGVEKSWAAAACNVISAWVNLRVGDLSQAEHLFEKALELVRDSGHFQILGGVHNGFGVIAKRRGEYNEALAHYQQALEFWILAEYLYGIQSVYFNIGQLHHVWGKQLASADTRLALQRYAVAQTWMEQCIALCEAAGTGYDTNDAEVLLSSVYRKTGQLQKALATAETAKRIAADAGNRRCLFLAYRSLLKTHLLMENQDAVQHLMQEASAALDSEYVKELQTVARNPDLP
jgi:tetratricopeptide (TPR) repeat protein